MPVFTGVDQGGRSANAAFNRRAAAIDMKNATRRTPLSKFERAALEQATEPAYIYNVSPVFSWSRQMKGLGSFLVQKADWYTLKDPIKFIPALVLSRRFVRYFDKGDGKFDHMVEEPKEIAEDVLRCSLDFPQRDQNNLLNYGCILIDTPLEKLSKQKQQEILIAASEKHEKICRQKVFEGDAWSGDPIMRRNISEETRKCALFLGEVEGRTWVTMRGPQKDRSKLKECQFCGFEMKNTAVKCPNCREVVDVEGYDAMKKPKK